MTDSFYWSASVGRWMGVPIRVHLLLILFVCVIFGVEYTYLEGRASVGTGTAFITTFVLLVSLLIHELAHVFALTNLGGHVNNLVFTPWGGNSDLALPESQRDRAVIALAGPFANGIIALLGCTALLQNDQASLDQLIYAFDPNIFQTSNWEVSIAIIATWVNFQLFFVNLLPCFPFDGGQVLRSVVSSVNPHATRHRSETSIMVIGHAVAFTMIGFAWLMKDGSAAIPPWFFLLVGGITLLFSARYAYYAETAHGDDDWDALDDIDYEPLYDQSAFADSSFFDFSEDETSQWLAEKQEARRREEERIEQEEDRRADEILKRLHQHGMESISDEDRQLLNRVSLRLKQRRKVSDSN